MTNEDLEKYADQYCINKFGAKTGNKSVRDALIDGYNLALRIHALSGQSEQLFCEKCKQRYTKEELEVGHCFNCGEH